MKRTIAGLCLALGLWSAPASAQWIYQGDESAFGDETLNLAMTGIGEYGFGLRCRGHAIEILFVTPDTSFTTEAMQLANATRPKLRVRVDDGPIIDLDTTIIDTRGQATMISSTDADFVRSVRDAKKRVAVVLDLMGQSYHEQSFNVHGSTNAVTKLIAGCGLAEK